MVIQARGRGVAAGTAGTTALRVVALALGVFFVALSTDKIAWLADSNILLQRLQGWLQMASPSARWYLETVCIPGAPLFARLVPLGELAIGVALIVGFWTQMAAIAAFLMVLNFQFAMSAFWSIEFLRDGAGLPVLGGLLALAIGGSRLPFSVSK